MGTEQGRRACSYVRAIATCMPTGASISCCPSTSAAGPSWPGPAEAGRGGPVMDGAASGKGVAAVRGSPSSTARQSSSSFVLAPPATFQPAQSASQPAQSAASQPASPQSSSAHQPSSDVAAQPSKVIFSRPWWPRIGETALPLRKEGQESANSRVRQNHQLPRAPSPHFTYIEQSRADGKWALSLAPQFQPVSVRTNVQ